MDGDAATDADRHDAGLRHALENLTQAVTLFTAIRDDRGTAVDMRPTYMNAAARVGLPATSPVIAQLCSRLWPQMIENGSFASCMRVLNTGVPAAGQFWWTEQETYRPGGYTFHASRIGDDTLLWELRETGTDLRRAHLLADITAVLATADDSEQVIDTLMTHGVIAVGADSGGVALHDPERDEYVVMSTHNPPPTTPSRFTFDRHAPYPMAHTATTGEPLFFATTEQRVRAFPEAEALLTRPWASTAILALRVDDRLLGAVSFHFAHPQIFDPAERVFLAALTGQCAQALERAHLRSATARAHSQISVLETFSDRLTATTDDDAVFDALLAAVVPELADGAMIHLDRNHDHPQLAGVAHADADQAAIIRQVLTRYPAASDGPAGIGRALRTGRPEVVTDVGTVLDALARDHDHRAALATIQATSWLIAAVQDSGERIGVLTLLRTSDQPYTERDIPFATELARRCSTAVRHARAYRRQEQVAHILQRSLLPRTLPAIDGLDLASCYRSGTRGLEAGGDFYDVFAAADGVTAVTIGDVCGTGAAAAARTALVRHSSRAYGRLLNDPAAVTVAVNAALREETLDGAFCSLAYATFRIGAAGAHMRVALAGHPFPLIRRADGSIETAGSSGIVLGVVPRPRHTVTDHRLEPGDTVVFYTDGATERRNGCQMLGEQGLVDLVADAPTGTAADLVRHLEEVILAYSDQPPTDDLAILALRVT